MITCFLRYTIDPDKVADFEYYARAWMRLIEKYGGTHHGYFVPADDTPSAAFSFPGIGAAGPDNIAVALFSFPDADTYETYRREVAKDPECLAVTSHYEQSNCFTDYERTFMRAVARDAGT